MVESVRRTKGMQSGPRSREVVDKVRQAVLQQLEEAGYSQLSMDGVAKSAGINRTTLYRRWSSKAALVASILEPQIEKLETEVSGISVLDALDALLLRLEQNLAEPGGKTLSRMLLSQEPEMLATIEAAQDRALATFRGPLEAAKVRGELAGETDVDMVAHLLFYGAISWSFRQGSIGQATRHRLIRQVLGSLTF